MANWNTERWDDLVSGADCPICRLGRGPDTVAELSVSYLNSGADGPMPGYCWIAAKRHVIEPYELSEAEAASFMHDIQRAGKAIRDVTGAVKLNYEIHGNTVPHLHVHIFPRYRGDQFEGRPIDPKAVKTSPYGEGEFSRFVSELRRALSSG